MALNLTRELTTAKGSSSCYNLIPEGYNSNGGKTYFGHSSRGLSLSQLGRCGRENSSHPSDQETERERELTRGGVLPFIPPGVPAQVTCCLNSGQVFAPPFPVGDCGRNTLRHTQRCALTATQVFSQAPRADKGELDSD